MVGIVLAYAVAAVAPNMEAANALLPTYVPLHSLAGWCSVALFLHFYHPPAGHISMVVSWMAWDDRHSEAIRRIPVVGSTWIRRMIPGS